MLAQKVELLCLHDVEYRILYYLADLATLVGPSKDDEGYQLPITQAELADLIGATRETTSTTLNQLERKGLVKLSRRLLTIPSPELLRGAGSNRTPLKAESA
jgi:CRP/FNR family transcriptional regulator